MAYHYHRPSLTADHFSEFNTEITELKAQKAVIAAHFQPVLQKIRENESNQQQQQQHAILKLLTESLRNSPIKDIFANPPFVGDKETLQDLNFFVASMEDDPSIGTQICSAWILKLKEGIQFAIRKHDYTYLLTSLLMEWLEIDLRGHAQIQPVVVQPDQLESAQTIQPDQQPKLTNHDAHAETANLEKSRAIDELNARIFSTPDFDKTTFSNFLTQDLFSVDKIHQPILDQINAETSTFFNVNQKWVDRDSLVECIKGLSSETFVSETNKLALRRLQYDGKEHLASLEMVALLNSKLTSLADWKWSDNIPVDVERGLAGHYHVIMDEDIPTMLFLQFVGVKWASYFKRQLLRIYDSDIWKRPKDFTPSSIQAFREKYHRDYIGSMLPDSMVGQDSNQGEYVHNEHSPIANQHHESKKYLRSQRPVESYEPRYPRPQPRPALLHVLATEIRLNQTIRADSPFVVVQADFDWLGESLFHESILAILEFFNVPKVWLDFFEKYLKTPITLSSRDPVKTRARGVPDTHVLSTLFKELVLFCLDLQINRKTGINLHRIHDEYWYWDSNMDTMVLVWNMLEKVGGMMGCALNHNKSGAIVTYSEAKLNEMCADREVPEISRIKCPAPLPSPHVRWAFLELRSNGMFKIDQKLVQIFTKEMKILLDKAECTFGFITIYNKFMTFFTHNFGKNAKIFNVQHITQVMKALKQIHQELFQLFSGNVLEALKSKFQILQDNKDVLADVCFYYPMESGGLGLVNPFLEVVGLRVGYEGYFNDQDLSHPLTDGFKSLLDSDVLTWNKEVQRKSGPDFDPTEPYYMNNVNTLEEYCAIRETVLENWWHMYAGYLTQTRPVIPPVTNDLKDWYGDDLFGHYKKDYMNCVFALYEPQLVKHFGSFVFKTRYANYTTLNEIMEHILKTSINI